MEPTLTAKKIPLKVEANFKSEEPLYVSDKRVRSRIIWNPDDRLKLYGGWINSIIIKAIK